MTSVGRNAPCPCGSGKKYKKCCLKKDQAAKAAEAATEMTVSTDSADSSSPPPQHTSGSRRRPIRTRHEERRSIAFERLLGKLWTTSVDTLRRIEQKRSVFAMVEVEEMFGLDLEECSDDEYRFVFAFTCFSGEIAGHIHEQFREAQRRALKKPSLVRLLAQFERTPLQIWCAHSDADGRIFEGHLVVGPESERLRPLDGVFTWNKKKGPGYYAGWPITYEGGRFLTMAMPLTPNVVNGFVEDADDLPISSFHDFWHELLFDVVYTIVPPIEDGWDWQEVGEDYHSSSRSTLSQWSWYRNDLLEMLETDIMPPLRLQIARARSAEDMKLILCQIEDFRSEKLQKLATIYNESLENIVPLELVLDRYGVAPDGSMSSELVVASSKHPVAILSVDTEVLHRARLESITPLEKALEWAETNPEHPSSEMLVDAAERYLTERRWLATLESEQRTHPEQPPRKLYDLYMEGFVSVVDGAVFDTTPEEMGVGKKALNRLRKALAAKSTPSTFDNLGDLPTSLAKLSDLPGIGDITLDDLASALFRCAQTWRESRSGVELQHVEAVKRSDDTELRDGLDELAALFGDLE